MKPIAFILFCFMISGCTMTYHPPSNEIIKVELARSGAWSDFGGSLSIDTSLNYKYYGDYGKIKQGYFIGKVDHKFWETLNRKFEHIKYKSLPVTDHSNTVDINYFELIIYWKNGKRRISRAWDRPVDSVLRVINWLDTSYKDMNLHQVKKPIQFETIYHRPQPKPSFNSVKFPPPIKQ